MRLQLDFCFTVHEPPYVCAGGGEVGRAEGDVEVVCVEGSPEGAGLLEAELIEPLLVALLESRLLFGHPVTDDVVHLAPPGVEPLLVAVACNFA